MPDEASRYKTLRSWLEDSLRVERDALSLSLARQHAELLRKLGPQLDGIPWTPSYGGDALASTVTIDCDEESKHFHVARAWTEGVDNNNEVPTPLTRRPQVQRGPQSGTPHVMQPQGHFDEDPVEVNARIDGNLADENHIDANGTDAQQVTNRRSLTSSELSSALSQAASNRRQITLASLSSSGAESGGQPSGRCQQFLNSPQMETFFCCLILLNTLVMAFEFQFRGLEVGFQVGYPGSMPSVKEMWPWAEGFFNVAEWVFGTLFLLELVMKLSVLRYRFFLEVWNIIDFVVVGAWLVGATNLAELPLSPTMLRLVRLARLLRLLRIVRSMRLFDSLYLMTTSMRGSFSALFWSVILLSFVQMMFALVLQQVTEGFVMNEGIPEENRLLVFKYYGSFARALLTMFEITLGNWMPPCRALFENVSEWYMLFSLAHKMIMGFSVVTVMTGVFIQETFKTATIDDRIMVMSKERAKKAVANKVRALFSLADFDGDGCVDPSEFEQIMSNPDVRMWLAAMDCDFGDHKAFFRMLDKDGDGMVSFEELLGGVVALRGGARSYDLAKVHERVQDVQQSLLDLEARLTMMGIAQK